MTFLAGEIAAYLLVATLLGVLVGWLLYRCGCRKSISELNSDIDDKQSQINSCNSELQMKEQQLLAANHDNVNLRSELALAQGNASLMESRWQSTLKQAHQVPNQMKWIQSLQHKLADTNIQLSQNRSYAEAMATEAKSTKENLQRVHTRLTEVDAHAANMKTWVHVFQSKLNAKKIAYGQLRNFATAVDQSDQANRENLQRVHSRLTEIDGKQQPLRTWIRVFQDKLKHTRTHYGQLRDYATAIQTELDAKKENLSRTHTRLTNVSRELQHIRKYGDTLMPAIPAKAEVKDNKVLRLVDRIRLLGTSKNDVYGRMNNQLREVRLESVQKERVLTDSCEEKDAIIYDLRQQLRKAENRAQHTPAPILDQSVKIKELEAELARKSSATDLEAQIQEHRLTIDAYRKKLAATKNQIYTERVQKPTAAVEKKVEKTSKPAAKKAKSNGHDDLKLIKGVGPKLEAMLNKLGINTFAQIAQWNNADIAQISTELGSFKDRITRDDWVAKAAELHKKKYG